MFKVSAQSSRLSFLSARYLSALLQQPPMQLSFSQIQNKQIVFSCPQKNCLTSHLHYSPTVASAFCQKSFGSICLTLVYRCCQKNQSTVFDIGPTFV